MKGYKSVLCAAVSLMCVLVLATTAFAADNFVGTWKLSLAKSKYDPADLAPKSATTKIEVVEGEMKFTFDGYDSEGEAIAKELSVRYDGKDYPVNDDPAQDTISLKKIDDYTFEQTSKKNGKVTITTRTVYSRDGKLRTETMTGTDTQGHKVANTVVWDRQA